MIKAKLPQGISVDQAKGALVTLAQDPNYAILCKFIETNDIEGLRNQLENEGIEEKEAQKIRYRIKVMREFSDMPTKILNALENEGKPQPEEDDCDPYDK